MMLPPLVILSLFARDIHVLVFVSSSLPLLLSCCWHAHSWLWTHSIYGSLLSILLLFFLNCWIGSLFDLIFDTCDIVPNVVDLVILWLSLLWNLISSVRLRLKILRSWCWVVYPSASCLYGWRAALILHYGSIVLISQLVHMWHF